MRGELHVTPAGALTGWRPHSPGPAPHAPAGANAVRFDPAANFRGLAPEARRRTVLGLLAAGQSYGEIALRLDITRGVVAGIAHRERKRIFRAPRIKSEG